MTIEEAEKVFAGSPLRGKELGRVYDLKKEDIAAFLFLLFTHEYHPKAFWGYAHSVMDAFKQRSDLAIQFPSAIIHMFMQDAKLREEYVLRSDWELWEFDGDPRDSPYYDPTNPDRPPVNSGLKFLIVQAVKAQKLIDSSETNTHE